MSSDTKGHDLTAGSVAAHLSRLTGPMVVGVFAVMSIGLADAYFIGRLGETELAAMGFVFPVTTALTSLGIGLSAGANALVSQTLGKKRYDAAQRFSAHSLVISFALGLLTATIVWLAHPALFSLLGARAQVLDAVSAYMKVWSLGFPLIALLLVSNSLVRAQGSTLVVSTIMVLNALFNVGLDPLLIFGWGPLPALGIAGAAWASFVAFAISCLVIAWPVLRTYRVMKPHHIFEPGYLESGRSLADVGVQAALANALNPAGLAIATAIVAQLGEAAVAGFGAAGRVQSFVLVPLLGLSGSIGPLVGQNWGAGAKHRAARAVYLSVVVCVGYGLLAATALTWFSRPVAALFSESSAVQDVCALYLRVVSWSFLGYGILVVINGALNARSRAFASLSLSAGRTFVLYLPLAALGAWLAGDVGMFSGILVANLVAAAAALMVARRENLLSSEALPNVSPPVRHR